MKGLAQRLSFLSGKARRIARAKLGGSETLRPKMTGYVYWECGGKKTNPRRGHKREGWVDIT